MLRAFENEVISVLDGGRPYWIDKTDVNGRFVQLGVFNDPNPEMLLELPASEIATLSPQKLRLRLEDKLRQR